MKEGGRIYDRAGERAGKEKKAPAENEKFKFPRTFLFHFHPALIRLTPGQCFLKVEWKKSV